MNCFSASKQRIENHKTFLYLRYKQQPAYINTASAPNFKQQRVVFPNASTIYKHLMQDMQKMDKSCNLALFWYTRGPSNFETEPRIFYRRQRSRTNELYLTCSFAAFWRRLHLNINPYWHTAMKTVSATWTPITGYGRPNNTYQVWKFCFMQKLVFKGVEGPFLFLPKIKCRERKGRRITQIPLNHRAYQCLRFRLHTSQGMSWWVIIGLEEKSLPCMFSTNQEW
jgi:hypothetical protein